MATSENIVLARPDDWEQWIAEIQAMADEGIWPHLDPDTPEPERGLRTNPEEPIIEEFDRNARSYAQLSAALQNRYDHARKHYDQDMKYFQRQQDLLREVRKYISTRLPAEETPSGEELYGARVAGPPEGGHRTDGKLHGD